MQARTLALRAHSISVPACASAVTTHCGRFETVVSRRGFLAKSAFGFGALALAHLEAAADSSRARFTQRTPNGESADPLTPKPPHFPATARSVIFLFMTGGPSHLETFDPKPLLRKLDGQPLPASFDPEGLSLQFMKATDGKLMASPFPFERHGQSGLEISSLFPNLARHADRLAVIRSCYHESFIHGPAIAYLSTGSLLLGHPSVGAWVTYGLGCESDNLPAYMVLSDGGFRGGNVMYQSGFLPAVYQGTVLRDEGVPIQNLAPPPQLTRAEQRLVLDQVQQWNDRHQVSRPGDSRLEARIANYELAFRMQTAAPELIDLSHETRVTRELYGVDHEPTARFGRMCLLARRMVERGVRYIQLINNDWDGHSECAGNHKTNAAHIDQPIAALLSDLHRRGLLDTTLVVWTGEFGRTPVMQGNKGRDHSPYGFTTWMAGGGVVGGKVIGATDDLGFRAVTDKVHVHDLHATMLSLLGLDHERLTYLFEGRQRRLTDIGGQNNLAERLTKA
ncbi:MAG TPA: DUF1501 domain-containing protein [Gemmataceae bacterium]|nr:DUF1501 domain-containing protein [Gemmataceae bacterium]